MVMSFRFIFSFLAFFLTVLVHFRSTHSLLHGISSASVYANLPYFLFGYFLRWQVSQLFTSFQTAFLIPGQYKRCTIIASTLLLMDEGYMYGTNIICNFGVLTK